MAHPRVLHVLEELHEEEAALERVRAEAQVLVVAAEGLVVEVDVEELARVPRLGHRVHEVEAGHVLVRHLGVDAHHLGVVEGLDEAEEGAGGRQVDVVPRLVGLGLEGEDEVVLPVLDVVGQEVERVAEALAGLERALGGVALDALAAAPEHVDLRPELDAEVDRVHRLLQRVGPHARVVGRERAVLERGVAEEVGGGHRDDDPGVGQGLLEVLHDPVVLGRRGVDRHEVVVVEVDAVGAHLGQQVDDLDRAEDRPHRLAERVAAGVADRPEAERELVLRLGGEGVAHG